MTERCWHRQLDAWRILGEAHARAKRGPVQLARYEAMLDLFAAFTGQRAETVQAELEAYAQSWAAGQ